VAKKRKGARPTASRSAKKTTRKTARRKVIAKKPRTGLESRTEVDFRPLKTQIRAHIERLTSAKDPTPGLQKALESLRQVQSVLSGECSPTMVLPTP
jgi:hypothetical protein